MTTDTNPIPIGLPPTEESPMSNAPGPGPGQTTSPATDPNRSHLPASARPTGTSV